MYNHVFQAAAGKDFVAELALVAQRLEWLTAVLDGNEVSVNAKIAKLTKEAMEDGKSSAARSRDEACAARSGPCPGFEELKPFSCLTEHTMKFANCQSMEDIKEVSQAMNPAKKTFTVLASACKTSLADLQFARAKAIEKAQEKERLEKERKRSGATLGKSTRKKQRATTSAHPLFKLLEGSSADSKNDSYMQNAEHWPEGFTFEDPFLLTGNTARELLEDTKFMNIARDFHNAFDESSLKVTEGRAAVPLEPEVIPSLLERCKTWVKPNGVVQFTASTANKDTSKYQALFSVRNGGSSFGIAAGTTSRPSYEVGQMPCLRAQSKGLRSVVVVQLRPLASFLVKKVPTGKHTFNSIKTWLEDASEKDLAELIADCKHIAVIATVGPNDILYTPPGSVVFSRVLNAMDVIGFRIGLISEKLLPLFQHLQELAGKSPRQELNEAVAYLTQCRGGAGEGQNRAAGALEAAVVEVPVEGALEAAAAAGALEAAAAGGLDVVADADDDAREARETEDAIAAVAQVKEAARVQSLKDEHGEQCVGQATSSLDEDGSVEKKEKEAAAQAAVNESVVVVNSGEEQQEEEEAADTEGTDGKNNVEPAATASEAASESAVAPEGAASESAVAPEGAASELADVPEGAADVCEEKEKAEVAVDAEGTDGSEESFQQLIAREKAEAIAAAGASSNLD